MARAGGASMAPDRSTYLRRPDLGEKAERRLPRLQAEDVDLAIVVVDGLSALAVQRHALPLLDILSLYWTLKAGRAQH